MTAAFRRRFPAPAVLNAWLRGNNPNNRAQPSFSRASHREVWAAAHDGGARGPGWPLPEQGSRPRWPANRTFSAAHCSAPLLTSTHQCHVLLNIHISPLLKPGKRPHILENRRPMSLLNTLVRVLECVIYRRTLPRVEPRLLPGQYAYRHSRDTERHLVSLIEQGKFSASFCRENMCTSFSLMSLAHSIMLHITSWFTPSSAWEFMGFPASSFTIGSKAVLFSSNTGHAQGRAMVRRPQLRLDSRKMGCSDTYCGFYFSTLFTRSWPHFLWSRERIRCGSRPDLCK